MVDAPPEKSTEIEMTSSSTPPAKPKKFRYLILSFKGLVRALSKGEITIEDLDLALMHFGKSKNYVFYDYQTDKDDPFKTWYREGRKLEIPETRRKLHAALEKAEVEARIIWRVETEKRTWKKVNILLQSNGYQPLTVDSYKNYNKTEIIFALKSRGETFIYIHD